ncbi:DNA-binding response OmpR family regulator [Bradyrhizobium japonicum]|uniref:Uncharacterized protein n=1 Tax=Bradyrhizobium japonicum TaxID=375 RepID=A0A1L3F6B4_BRAJP|nr:hypothetical protein RN69_15425 [Bradyrhizobium japonicum]MCS3927131.1 DNA-binding response OmpR family regulator [Bradyrhizobium elkanii]BAL08447.1 hypothetical protein BJ6T_31720 [Bradyrhizobium japonicum USDA 6]APG08855.1 hypothetical protein BKD09_10980 [Bradyrhizobium japonicum]KMJ95093.1 hypothetical protein CF64_32965 [Bradyrhizobium japonicum]
MSALGQKPEADINRDPALSAILRDIRSDSDIPVIIITGHHPDEIDRIVGLELGADDYLLKPFGLRDA